MTLKYLSMSAAIAAMFAGGAIAQDTTTDPEAVPAVDGSPVIDDTAMLAPEFTSIEEMTVADVLGMIVYDPTGDQIGEIDYVIAGVGGPEAVIGIGGFLGLGEYTVALPMYEFDLREDGRSFEVDTDKETLEQMPEFDESGAESLPDDIQIASLLLDEDMTEDTMDDGDAMGDDAAADDTVTDDAATDDGAMDADPEMDDTATEEETTTQ